MLPGLRGGRHARQLCHSPGPGSGGAGGGTHQEAPGLHSGSRPPRDGGPRAGRRRQGQRPRNGPAPAPLPPFLRHMQSWRQPAGFPRSSPQRPSLGCSRPPACESPRSRPQPWTRRRVLRDAPAPHVDADPKPRSSPGLLTRGSTRRSSRPSLGSVGGWSGSRHSGRRLSTGPAARCEGQARGGRGKRHSGRARGPTGRGC